MSNFINFWQSIPSRLDPVFFHIGPTELRYYGLMYIVAFAVTYLLMRYRMKHESRFEISVEQLDNLVFWIFLGVILGGRLGYALFYDLGYFVAHPLRLLIPYDFAANQFVGISGMSFHGGLIGAALAGMIACKKSKVNFWEFSDLVFPAAPLGYMFGRIGNFLNNELWGRPTDFALGMHVSPDELFLRHPSQLYEAFLEGLVLFIVLWAIRKKEWATNRMLSFFLIGYAIARVIVEFFREPDAHLGFIALGLTMGQLLSLTMLGIGFTFIFLKK